MASALRQISFSKFFSDFTPILPYLPIYLIQAGMTLAQVSSLFFFWSLSVLLWEIPTGMIADRFDRKTILIISRLLKGTVFCIWAFSTQYSGFLFGFLLWGLATALDSGAFQAFLFDVTERIGQSADFSNIYGKVSSFGFFGLIGASIVASLLYSYGFTILLFLGSISLALSIFFLALAPSASKKEPTMTPFSFKEQVFHLKYIFNYRYLLLLVVIGAVSGGVKGSLDEYLPLLIENKNVALSFVAVVLAALEILKSLGSYFSAYAESHWKKYQAYFVVVIGLSMLCSGLIDGHLALLALVILVLMDVVLWVLNDAEIIRVARDKNRATTLSVKNFGVECVALFVFLALSLGVNNYAVPDLFIAGGVILLSLGVILRFAERDFQSQNKLLLK